MMSIVQTEAISLSLLSVGTLINSIETIYARADYRDGGILDSRWSGVETLPARDRRWPAKLISSPVTHLALAMLRIVAVLGIWWWWFTVGRIDPMCVWFVAITTMLYHWRMHAGLDGSDQMSVILWISTAIAVTAGESSVAIACLFFQAFQVCLAYLTSGLSKVASATWRSGTAVLYVADTRSYGNEILARKLLSRRWILPVLAWMVMLWESLFFLAVVFGSPVLYIFCLLGIVFHTSVSLLMGLNLFLFSFSAAYPACFWVAAFLAT